MVCLFAPVVRPAIAPLSVNPAGESKGLVVLQSHDSTCAPASAATLLGLNGIQSNEAEMIGPCLTSEFGTEALGLYRGIKIGCKGTNLEVGVADRNPKQWAATGQLPNVALVRFPSDEFESSVSQSELRRANPNWFSGIHNRADGHAVVIVDYQDGSWTIADPAVGLVKWSDSELQTRFTGEAIYLFRQ